MKKMHPAVLYILFWVTAGIFGLIWGFVLMGELNTRLDRKEFSVKRGIVFSVLILLYGIISFTVIEPLVHENGMAVFFAIQVLVSSAWIIALFVTLIRFARIIGELQEAQKAEKICSVPLAILLFFVYFGTLPYLHSHYRTLE